MLYWVFPVLVVVGFLFQFLAVASTWPRPPTSTKIAWGAWLAASLVFYASYIGTVH